MYTPRSGSEGASKVSESLFRRGRTKRVAQFLANPSLLFSSSSSSFAKSSSRSSSQLEFREEQEEFRTSTMPLPTITLESSSSDQARGTNWPRSRAGSMGQHVGGQGKTKHISFISSDSSFRLQVILLQCPLLGLPTTSARCAAPLRLRSSDRRQ